MRKLALVLLCCAAWVNVCYGALDKYGGSDKQQCAGGVQPHFYTEIIASRWWLCTPAGNVYFANGMWNINGIPDPSLPFAF